jgi:hypothetical protein
MKYQKYDYITDKNEHETSRNVTAIDCSSLIKVLQLLSVITEMCK